MQTRKPAPKPTLTAKLVAWRTAYHAVLDEMRADHPAIKPGEWADYNLAEHLTVAAQVAAQLVAGADLEAE